MRRSTRVSVAALAVTTFALTAGCGRSDDAGGDGSTAEAVADRGRQRHRHGLGDGHRGRGARRLRRGVHGGEPRRRRSTSRPSPGTPRTTRSRRRSPAGETPDVSMIGTTWMGEFAATGALDPTARPHRQRDVLRGRLGHHRAWAARHYGVPVVRRDPRPLLPHRPGGAGRRLADPRDWDGPDGDGQGHAGRRRRVGHQPAARADRRVADVPAVRLAGRRRDHQRGRRPSSRSTAPSSSRRSPTTSRSSPTASRPTELPRGHARARLRGRHDRRRSSPARGTSGSSRTPAARASSTA